MKEYFKKVIPSSIWRIDNYLLTNKPLFWSSRLMFLIYFELIFLAVGLLITQFQPIRFNNVPNSAWILSYGLVVNIAVLGRWLFFQTLFDIKFYHGKKIRFQNIRIVFYFFLAFLITGIVIILPFRNLNHRIIATFTDNALAAQHHTSTYHQRMERMPDRQRILPTTGSNASSDSTLLADYTSLRNVQEIYTLLGQEERNDISIALTGSSLEGRSPLYIDRSSSVPFLQYIETRYETQNNPGLERYKTFKDTITVFYQTILTSDSVFSDKFKRKVFYRAIAAKNGERDSIIESAYYRNKRGKLVVAMDRDIQMSLISDTIQNIFNPSGKDLEGKTEYEIRQLQSEPEQALRSNLDFAFTAGGGGGETFVVIVFVTALIASLVFTVFIIIRFLGINSFFLGLILPGSIIGLLIVTLYFTGDTFRMIINSPNGPVLFYLVLALFAASLLLICLYNKRKANLLTFQLALYTTWFLLVFMPFFFESLGFSIVQVTVFIMCCAVGLLLLPGIFLSRLYHIYSLPKE